MSDTVHHDLWDHDLPVSPNLVEIEKDGRTVEAAVQVTKGGFVFVFDRESGEPLFEVREQPVSASDTPGEEAWPTQPIPVKPAPLASQSVTEADLTNLSDAAHAAALKGQAKLPAGGYATPCTYMVDGRQYVAIAAGGAGKLGTRAGDSFVVYALP